MNPDNDNWTLHLDEQEALKEFQKALGEGRWVAASEIQAGDIDKGKIPEGFNYKITRDAKDVR